MIAKVSPHHHITMLDVNRRALELAKKNKKKNHIENADIFESDGMTQVDNNQFDFVNKSANQGAKLSFIVFLKKRIKN